MRRYVNPRNWGWRCRGSNLAPHIYVFSLAIFYSMRVGGLESTCYRETQFVALHAILWALMVKDAVPWHGILWCEIPLSVVPYGYNYGTLSMVYNVGTRHYSSTDCLEHKGNFA